MQPMIHTGWKSRGFAHKVFVKCFWENFIGLQKKFKGRYFGHFFKLMTYLIIPPPPTPGPTENDTSIQHRTILKTRNKIFILNKRSIFGLRNLVVFVVAWLVGEEKVILELSVRPPPSEPNVDGAFVN